MEFYYHVSKKWSELWESLRSHQPKSLISSLLVRGYGWLNPNLFCFIKKRGGTCEAGAVNWRWFETYRSQVCKFQMGFLQQERAVWNDLKSEHFHKWGPGLRRTRAGPQVKGSVSYLCIFISESPARFWKETLACCPQTPDPPNYSREVRNPPPSPSPAGLSVESSATAGGPLAPLSPDHHPSPSRTHSLPPLLL